jgi:subtilisin family serine protease
MKKITFLLLLLVVLHSQLWSEDNSFCGRTLIVVLEPEYSSFAASLDKSFFGKIEIESIKNISLITCVEAIKVMTDNKTIFKSIFKLTLPIECKANVIAVVDEINKLVGVAYAMPNYLLLPAHIPNDPHWYNPPAVAHNLWALRGGYGIRAPEAWKISVGSRNVRVGIIDTGVGKLDQTTNRIGHTDLNCNLVPGINYYCPHGMSPNPGDTSDYYSGGHGTQVAGILGAVGNNGLGTVGVNWNVTLFPYRVIDRIFAVTTHCVQAITDAINKWGIPSQRIHILNFSFEGYGETHSLPIRDMLYSFQNILFIWSAGNWGDNFDDPVRYPLIADGTFTLPNIIAVGAHDRFGQRSIWTERQTSSFSPSNTHVNLFAPGSDGWTTHTYNRFGTFRGTSMAAPYVAGVAALMLSINPSLIPAQIKLDLIASSDALTISAPGHQSFPVSKLNAFKAVLNTSSRIFTTSTNIPSGLSLFLDKGFSVKSDATVTLTNNIISHDHTGGVLPEYFGFQVFSGTLILDGCFFNSPVHLLADGPNSHIIIRNSDTNNSSDNIKSITVSNGAIIILENNSTLVLRDGSKMNLDIHSRLYIDSCSSLELKNGSHLTLNNRSELYLHGGTLSLSGRSRVTLNSASKWHASQNAHIIGHSLGHMVNQQDQIRGYSLSHPLELIEPMSQSLEIPGDRIVVNQSWVGFDTVTIKSGSNTLWDGIYFYNCHPNGDNITQPSLIRGAISGIRTIFLQNSVVNVENLLFSRNGFIYATDGSRLRIENSKITDNYNGITAEGSFLWIEDSEIVDNRGYFGVMVAYCDDPTSTIINSAIRSNEGIGLQVDHGFIRVTDTVITENSKWGIYNLSSNPIVVMGATHITNNEFSELISTHAGFPEFVWHPITFERPEIKKDSYIPETLGQLLIHTIPPFFDTIYTHHLLVDSSDDSRFEPNLSHFKFFAPVKPCIQVMYYESLQYALNGDFPAALDGFKNLIRVYPDEYQAKRALAMLPYLYNDDADKRELFDYLDQITENYLQHSITEIKAMLHIYDKQYIEAINLYQIILTDPPNNLSALLAELNAGYAYYKWIMEGNLPNRMQVDIPHKPQHYEEFLELQQSIHNKILNLGNHEDTEPHVPIVTEFSLGRNYPNPFNPETTISFALPKDRSVILSIYNVRGQLVKTLINKDMSAGTHQTIWHGTDEHGRTVSSGIYFYRLTADEFSKTQKMLLLK